MFGVNLIKAVFPDPFHRMWPNGPVIETRPVQTEPVRLQGDRDRVRYLLNAIHSLSEREGRDQVLLRLELRSEFPDLGIQCG